jgi:ADP-dependent NAD(P)H-hydrate dehydratase / NAD(P)H-hydrate epimerase
MLPILTAAHMSEVDRLTTERFGISGMLLMENAAVGATLAIERHFGPVAGKRFRIFCGKGNNGGDGAAVGRQLWMRGGQVEVLLFGKRETAKGDARTNFDIVNALAGQSDRIKIREILSESEFTTLTSEKLPDLHIDALFGTGLTRGLEGIFVRVVEYLNAARWDETAPIPICSLDLPSGLAGDDGNFIGSHVAADLTVTFTAPKVANVIPPASDANGILRVIHIGSPAALVASTGTHTTQLHLVEPDDIRAFLSRTKRPVGAHKGTVGHVLLVAGSRGKTGAAALSAEAVLRSGAGLLTVATPTTSQRMLVSQCVAEAMTIGVAETPNGGYAFDAVNVLLGAAQARTVLAIGPGIGEEETTKRVVRHLTEMSTVPLVLDADALNCLSPWRELRGTAERPIIVTPHPGEMARLLDVSTKTVTADRIGQARRLAVGFGLIVVLKGQRTVVAAPDGNVYINPTGNPGMATGGSGDVLTGILSGLLAQTPQHALKATLAAVYLHGLAGDLATGDLCERAIIASDITRHLAAAFNTAQK